MFVTKKSISRRTVLRGVGTAVALPLLDAMVPAFAPAAATNPVRRFGVVYHPNGIIYDQWLPLGNTEPRVTRFPRSRDFPGPRDVDRYGARIAVLDRK